MRALVVSNMAASREHPARGVFVRDQVAALRRRSGVAVELYEFLPGAANYPLAALSLRRRFSTRPFDIVHAHFGLTAWPALAVPAARHMVTLHGTDVRHPRTRPLTLAALRRMDLVATVSAALAAELGPRDPPPVVLPCGIATERFRPIPRDAARLALGLDRSQPCLLFPADPRRAGKRFDRALEVAGGVRLITLGATAPDHVVLAINAANAVLVPSDAEGFGLAVLEALACDVPVLATPVGIHAEALDGIAGTLCAPYDRIAWSAALRPLLDDPDPRVAGQERAARYSADAMAERVAGAWLALLGEPQRPAA